MEGASRGSAVAEETDRHLIRPAHLAGECGAGGGRNTRAHDTVGAQHVEREIRDVHRTALSGAGAVALPNNSAIILVRLGALGYAMSVAAMRAQNIIVIS